MKIISLINEIANGTQPIDEGVYDKAFLKAIYLAGGPGSGKSYVVSKTMTSFGLKIINTDTRLERYLKDAGISLKFADNPDQAAAKNIIRYAAKAKTDDERKFRQKYQQGIIIDTTASSISKTENSLKTLASLGYDVLLVFVETSLETALKRNAQRPRTLPTEVVSSIWKDAIKNKDALINLFGKHHSVIIHNDDGNDASLQQGYKDIAKFINAPIKNPIGQGIRDQQLKDKKRT